MSVCRLRDIQSRLEGQINPLRPPLHVETVLIGRALGQLTGYLFGVGLRVRDDGTLRLNFRTAYENSTRMRNLRLRSPVFVGRNESA